MFIVNNVKWHSTARIVCAVCGLACSASEWRQWLSVAGKAGAALVNTGPSPSPHREGHTQGPVITPLLPPSFHLPPPMLAGWVGGQYGVGSRISLKHTRAILDAIHSGELDRAPCVQTPVFGLQVPKACSGVPSEVLMPDSAWKDKAEFGAKLNRLGAMFAKVGRGFRGRGRAAAARWMELGGAGTVALLGGEALGLERVARHCEGAWPDSSRRGMCLGPAQRP